MGFVAPWVGPLESRCVGHEDDGQAPFGDCLGYDISFVNFTHIFIFYLTFFLKEDESKDEGKP